MIATWSQSRLVKAWQRREVRKRLRAIGLASLLLDALPADRKRRPAVRAFDGMECT